MKPFKTLSPFSSWLLRIGVLLVTLANVWPSLKSFSFSSINSYISLAYLAFAVFLFWGGFLKKHTLTIISGLILLLLSGWIAYHSTIGGLFGIITASYILVGFVGFHFFINGNN